MLLYELDDRPYKRKFSAAFPGSNNGKGENGDIFCKKGPSGRQAALHKVYYKRWSNKSQAVRRGAELVSGEIAEDLTYYYAKSEQIPTAIALGVLVDTDTSIKAAGGFIIQLMPGATLEVATMLEERITHLKYITELLDRGETPETILDAVLGDMDLEIIDKMPTEFYCDCSRERVEKALISIGEKDLRTILEEDKKAEISCHFCNKVYNFDEADLKKLLDEATSK